LDSSEVALVQALQSLIEAHNSRDWDRVRSILADEYEFHDHRPAGFGTIVGREGFIEFLLAAISLVPDRRMSFTRWFRDPEAHIDPARPETVAALLRAEGTDQYGSPVEWELMTVWQAKGGLVTWFEAYPHESVEEAIERARQLSDSANEEA